MGAMILIILIIVAGLFMKHNFNHWRAQDTAQTQAVVSQMNAANNGDVEAMYWLGTYYMNERSHMKDLSSGRAEDLKSRSIQWYTKAIECGDTRSMIDLSLQYSDMLNTNESGFGFYTNNTGFGYDPEKELAFLRMAAEAGDAEAQHSFALEIEDDRNKLYWLEKSASQGHFGAYQKLGDFYGNKLGNPSDNEKEDLGKAEYYYYLAMQSRDEFTCPTVAYDLGMIFGRSYCFGNVPNSYEDPERAIYWFYQASLWGNEHGQDYIDKIIQNSGIAISRDKYRQWRFDFENNHYLTDEQCIPQGTKYHFRVRLNDGRMIST